MENYNPINCEVHDGFELACMRHAVHELCWQSEQGPRCEKLRFMDLEYTAEGEFLLAENRNGEKFRIRLDMITSKLPY